MGARKRFDFSMRARGWRMAWSGLAALLLSIGMGPAVVGQYVAGDYGSWVSGNWNTLATWRVYDGVSWASSPTATAVPNATNRVWIRSGTTVTAVFGSVYHCQDLFIEPTARLYNNNTGATNMSYVHVWGSTIEVNGNLGNGATLDGISLGISGANVTLSGTGTVNVARIRKELVTNPVTGMAVTTSNFTIARNVNLRFSGGSTTTLYNGGVSACVFNVTINAGVTVTIIGPAGFGNVSIDGVAGADGVNLGGTFTINGTLIIPGVLHATTNNAAGGNPCRITIGSTGIVRTTSINANTSGAAGHTLEVLSGGLLEINGSPAWNNYFVTNNTYLFNANSLTIYNGMGVQDVRHVTGGYGHLRITGSSLKQLTGTLLVKGNLEINNAMGSPVLDVTISNFQLTVQGNWTNYNQSGFNEQTGLVLFNGTTSTQTVTCPGGEEFFLWRIAKSAANPMVQLNSPVTVAQTLELNNTGSILNLNGNQLRLLNPAASAISTNSTFSAQRHIRSERTDNTSRVRWEIGTASGAHLVPFGTATAYIPFTFNLLSGDAGSVTMATYGTPPDNMPLPVTPTTVYALPSSYGLMPDNAEATVDRFWQVDVTGAPLAHLTFAYMASELPASPLNDPNMYRAQRYNSAVPYWEDQLESTGNGSFFATANNVSAFGPFALSHLWSPLPVELLRFDAMAEGQAVRLEWATASEVNNDRFVVLRSRDGVDYAPIVEVPGSGTRNTPQEYRAYDREPFPGVGFYKLRQFDTDGSWSDSPVRVVRLEGAARPLLYPNPVRGTAFLMGLPDGAVDLRLEDAAGRLVATARKTGDGDRFEWPLEALPAGSYILTCTGAQGAATVRLVAE